jgi:ABC-type branched-subunit amino acid transport system permease subunit
MGFAAHIFLVFGLGLLFSIAAHLHWQTARQLMPATGAVGLFAAYTFGVFSNLGLHWVLSAFLSLFVGALVGGSFFVIARNLTRSEFLLLGLAIVEICRRVAYEWDSVTRGAYGLNLQSAPFQSFSSTSCFAGIVALFALAWLSLWWYRPVGLVWRLGGAASRCAALIGIDTRSSERNGALVAGACAAVAGVFYCMAIRYVHPDDLGLAVGIPALAVGLAAKPRRLAFELPALALLLFASRELLRFVGTGTERFAWHDVAIGVTLIAVAIRLGRQREMEEES